MRKDKAHAMIKSIIATHVEAVGADPARAADALRNAESDLHLLVDEMYGDFDEAAQQALDVLDDARDEFHGEEDGRG